MMDDQELRAAIEADVMGIATAKWFNTPETVAAEVDRRLAGMANHPPREHTQDGSRWQRSRRIGEPWTPWEEY